MKKSIKENKTMVKKNKNMKFKWNVWRWDFNHDMLEEYDVVPLFLYELNSLKKDEKPKTKVEFEKFLDTEARYRFWSKCEWEMIIHGWPEQKNDKKVDVYQQLKMNWNVFVDAFWNHYSKTLKSSHRKQRGRTAPNKAVKR